MFENEYEPDNLLQSFWDITNSGSCLCTMRESCGWCDYGASKRRDEINKKILQQAKDSGYQIYLDCGRNKVNYEYVSKTFNLN